MNWSKIWLLALWNAGTMVVMDLDSYSRARAAWVNTPEKPAPTFDWKLFTSRLIKGLISGALAGAGIDAASAALP